MYIHRHERTIIPFCRLVACLSLSACVHHASPAPIAAKPVVAEPRAASAVANAPDAVLCSLSRSFGSRPSLIVDLRLVSGPANRTPTTADSQAVARVGGRVLHSFHVAVMRIAVDTGALRTLLTEPTAIATVAYPVTDTTRFGVNVQVFLRHTPMPPAEDSTLRRLTMGHGPFYGASVPDSAIPLIAALPDVASVRAQAMVCAVVNGG